METPTDEAPIPQSGATAAQLKGDIDAGRTGDKVAGFDPGAAPLGTDEEAGGAPHDPHLIAQVRSQERTGPSSATANAATPELQPDARMGRTPVAAPLIAGVVVAVILVLLLAATL
jgi:hypothetical protein